MIAYKVAKNGDKRVIVTLEIPEDALTNMNRLNIAVKQSAKYRANKAKVLKIEDNEGNTYETAESQFYSKNRLTYNVGEIVVSEDFDIDFEKVCSTGIHFFLDRKIAEQYGLQRLENGMLTYYHDNGQLDISTPFVNGKEEGFCEAYHPNGQKISECTLVNGRVHGSVKCWYPNGQKQSEWNEDNGKAQGIYYTWYSNGKRKGLCNYKDGKLDGLKQLWYLSGKKHSEENYKHGKPDGLAMVWDEASNIKEEVYYIDGVKQKTNILENS